MPDLINIGAVKACAAKHMLSERQICDVLYAWMQEGRNGRHTGAPNRYAANTIAHSMSCAGWLQEDLRLALCKANPTYAASQTAFDQPTQEIDNAK